ncbi:MAG TPA: DUF6518 family protein [Micromonosporaceae bacterium]|nr:DUF6518 family protein [Micromonosporaceae bacterium]
MRGLLAGLMVGLVVGVVAAAAHRVGGPGYPDSVRTLAHVTNYASVWAGIAFVAGFIAPRRWLAATSGVLALLVAVIVYYPVDMTVGTRVEMDLAWVLPTMIRWCAISVPTGIVFGLLGHVVRTADDAARRRAALPLPILLFGETAFHLGQTFPYGHQGGRELVLTGLLVAAAATAGLLIVGVRRTDG